jgi:hypothetical protein
MKPKKKKYNQRLSKFNYPLTIFNRSIFIESWSERLISTYCNQMKTSKSFIMNYRKHLR